MGQGLRVYREAIAQGVHYEAIQAVQDTSSGCDTT